MRCMLHQLRCRALFPQPILSQTNLGYSFIWYQTRFAMTTFAPTTGTAASSAIVPTGLTSLGVASSAPFNFGHLITIKLSHETYMFWRAQVTSLLRSHLLLSYVEGMFPCPASTLSVVQKGKDVLQADSMTVVPNPAFTAWQQQDQAIMSAILSSSTIEVAGMVRFATTSQEAWSMLSSSFASQSTARAMQIRSQLAAVKKLDSSAVTFFNKVKSLSDILTSIGKPLHPEEFTSYILDGLDEEYDALVEMVLGRDAPCRS